MGASGGNGLAPLRPPGRECAVVPFWAFPCAGAVGIVSGAEMYWLLKLHIATALLSLAGFVTRGVWMLRGSERLRARWVRIAPHFVDTVLLGSGIGLVLAFRLYPTEQPWLAAKLTALAVYVVLGTIALKRGRTRGARAGALGAALAVFFYILAVAVTHRVVPVGVAL